MNTLISDVQKSQVEATKELKEVVELIEEKQNNIDEDVELEIQELEREKIELLRELGELENTEKELLELELEESEEDEKDEIVNTEKYYKSLEKEVIQPKEKKQHVQSTKKQVEDEIKQLLSSFSTKLSACLKPFQRRYRNGMLSKNDVDDIVDLHNELREDANLKLKYSLDGLDEGDDLSERFYRYINDYFNRKLQRVERMIE